MIAMLAFGLYLEYGGLAREAKGPMVGIHKSVGLLVPVLGLWRVSWRLVNGFPANLAEMPKWQAVDASAAHWTLLAGILIMPISGLVASLFHGRAVSLFDWFTIPRASRGALARIDRFRHSQRRRPRPDATGAATCRRRAQTPLRRPRRNVGAHADRARLGDGNR